MKSLLAAGLSLLRVRCSSPADHRKDLTGWSLPGPHSYSVWQLIPEDFWRFSNHSCAAPNGHVLQTTHIMQNRLVGALKHVLPHQNHMELFVYLLLSQYHTHSPHTPVEYYSWGTKSEKPVLWQKYNGFYLERELLKTFKHHAKRFLGPGTNKSQTNPLSPFIILSSSAPCAASALVR